MASDKKILTCANDPNFAIICTFFHKFSKPLNLGHPNIQLLQEWLEDTEEVSPGLKQLHIKLLRKLRKTVHETAWETALSKFCWFYSAQDAWEIERFGYKKASLRVKLRVLRELVESQFEINGKFRTITQTMTADELRTEPIGRDKLGHSYWLAQDPDCNLRVFQEHLDEEIWQVVATNRDELVTLINRLRGNEVVLPSLVGAIDEDSSSNSCSGNVIKPPPPEERDESQDDDDKKILADDKPEQINEKIPNIKIKFDKIVDNNYNEIQIVNNTSSAKVEKLKIKTDNQCEKKEFVEENVQEEDKDDEEEEFEEENLSESEAENKDQDKPKQYEKKINSKNVKKLHNKKNTSKNNDSDKKIKPLIISQSKITLSASNSDDKCRDNAITTISLTKKRPLADTEPDIKETEEVFKKARPTLLDARRKKNISKYEKFKDDSEDEDDDDDDDDDEEGEGDDEEEEGEEEDDSEEGEEEDNEEENTEDEEVGEVIEEKILIVKGSGSGKDCKSCYQDFIIQSNASSSYEENVGDAIEEDVFYVYGEGSGVDCLVGNPSKENESKSPPKATFYFGEPGCLKLSPVKKKPPVTTVIDKIDDKHTLCDKSDNKEVSTSSKEEISNNISLRNGENENLIENKGKTLPETIDENHKNDKIIEDTTNKCQEIEDVNTNKNTINTSQQSETEKSISKSVESTSNLQNDVIPQSLDKTLIGKSANIVVSKTYSQIEICETNNANNVLQNSDKSIVTGVNNETPSTSIEKIKIPEILITDNESAYLIKTSVASEVDNKLNSPKSLQNTINLSENELTDQIVETPQDFENATQDNKNDSTEKLCVYKLSEHIERITENPTKDNINLKVKDVVQPVFSNQTETNVVDCKSIDLKIVKPIEDFVLPEEVTISENTAESIKLIVKPPKTFSEPKKEPKCTLESDNIAQDLDNEKLADDALKSSVKSTESTISLEIFSQDHTKSSEKFICSAEIPHASQHIEKLASPIINTSIEPLTQNSSSDDTNILKITDSKEKSKIEEAAIESVVPFKIVPQSPAMPKKSLSSSISNTLKPEEIAKHQINLTPPIPNRKRRLSPVADHNTAHLPPEKPRRISESSETDLNSENVDEEFLEEEDNDNLGDDVGGKRARFRLKIVNTDLRKKIEAQRKFGSKDTGSSSSGEDERPRKKLSPRKAFAKNQIGETSKVFQKIDDENNVDVKEHKTISKLDTESVLKSRNLTADEVDKSSDIKKEIIQNFESQLTNQNNRKSEVPESSVSTKISNKKISPSKLADKIEFLKQSKEQDLGKMTTTTTSSSTVMHQKSIMPSKDLPIKQEGMTIKKRISPKKIEDKIEVLKQNIEKTVNLGNTQKHETVDVQDVGRARKRSSPPKTLNELSKDLNLTEISSFNRESEVQDKSQTNKFKHELKDGESDEKIPRKRTISEESSDLKAIIVNLNENKNKPFERHSSTDEDRSRKRTICDNQSVEQINQQPAEKSSKTDEPTDVVPKTLEFNTKKREAARKIAEDKLKIEVRNSEDDDRPKKRTITSEGTDQSGVERSEKFSKIQKPTVSSEKILPTNIFPKTQIPEEQTLPEDLSRKSSSHFPVTKKKAIAVEGATEERVKLKFPKNENIVASDKKLKLSSAVSQSPQSETQKQIIGPQKLQMKTVQKCETVLKADSKENENTKVITSAVQNSTESEDERPRKRSINTDKAQDHSSNEIKKDKIDEPQALKTFVSPPEKMKIVEKSEEKIKIVVKTCSVSESAPSLPVLFERVVSDRGSPEIPKTSAMKISPFSVKKNSQTPKKSPVACVKKSSPETITLSEKSFDIKKESESSIPSGPVKTRHTRRAGDAEPLLELTLAQTKRKSRQFINQTSQKVTPITSSAICPPIGKKPKKNDEAVEDKLELVECKIEPKDEKLDKESDDKIIVEENPIRKVTEISKTMNDKTANNLKQLTVSVTSPKDSPAKTIGRQQRRKREIDISNIIDTESEAAPMRQSRRIAQLKIREEAERRKLEEIALKKMKEDLKRKKKEEKKQLTDDPTVVTEPSESDSDYKDDSDVELKKKFDKKKKGKKSGWSSGSNEEDDHDVDDDDLFKYPASDHGSPLFKSDHEFSPESEIEDESQVVPLKRARTARKEGENLVQGSGIKEHDVDESCQKCGKSDHPEWILLCDKCDKGYHCSCLSPVLFIIPEGDWFCPPCQQEQLIAALEKHLKEFDNLILSKKLEEEERIKTLELEAAEQERQKERDALEAAENELEGKSGNKKKSSESTEKNRRRKATAKTCDENSQDYENETKSSDVSSDERSDSRRKRSDRRNQRKNDRKNINRKKASGAGSSENSATNSSSSENDSGNKNSATDSDDEPIYKLRKRRQTNISYRFNDYDELINRAIKKDENQGIIYSDDEAEDEEGAGNLGRGKDISTILEADKEEKARQKQKDNEEKGVKSDDSEEKAMKTKGDDDSGSDFEPLKTKQKTFANKKQRKKKNRKLNCLDISSEDDGSDEDFRTSSEEEDEDDESFSVSSGSDSSLEMYRRRSKNKNFRKSSRRVARERKKIRDFVVEGSDDESEEEEKPKLKKKRKQVESDFTESDLDDDDDDELSEDLDSDDLCDDDSTDSDQSGWRPSKRKKQKTASIQKKKSCGKSAATHNITSSGKSPRQTIGKEIPKIVAAKKKSKRMDDDEKSFKGSGIVKKNRRRISDSGSSSSSDGAGGRKTRGRRLFYMDDYDDEESSDGGIKPGVKRPDTPPEEREQFIKRQEEIKRMLAEKNVNKETEESSKTASVTDVSQSTKGPEKTGAGDSLSAVPLSVIRAAKALDVDYLQRKGEIGEQSENEDDDDEAAAASAFGDDLPDDFNPDDMDEEAIAKIMEEEDFPQHQQLKALPLPSDVLKQQHKKLNTPPKVPPPHPLPQQQTSVIQDPIVRKRLPMPTFHPLMRPSHPTSSGGLQHLPLLQSALTNPVGMAQPPQQLTPGVPMSHHRPPQQHPLIQSPQTQIPPQTSKPRGRRKKITPLRDPVEKAAAVAAATTTSASTTTNQNPILQNSPLPTNLSSKESSPAGSISSLQPSALQTQIPSGNLNVAQPPQLYKPPTNSPQPSVITRMPQMPPRQRFPDQESRYYPPPGGVSPNQLIPPHHRSQSGSLRHSLMTMHHQPPPPYHTLRPSYAGGPPPLRPGGPPLRPGSTPSLLRHPASSGVRVPPPTTSATAINLGNGIGREQTLARQQQSGPSQFTAEQFAGAHRSRHPTPPLTPYRPPLYGSPGYPPAPPSQHAVGSYPPGSPYGSYFPPPSLGPPTHSSTPSNSVIIAAAAAVSAAAASTVVVTPTRLAIPTSVVHHPTNQQQLPPRSSLGHSNLPPPPHRPTKVTTLETFNAKRTSPPLDLQQSQPSTLLHSRGGNDDDDEDDDGANATPGTASVSSASEFSGLVSYFSSQHDEF